jgi:hypothetical protein
MIYKKHGKTYEQFELDLKIPEPEQLTLEFEFHELAADEMNLNNSKQNQKEEN